jgi:glycosyltransferase involved in cell wall biosynthesis
LIGYFHNTRDRAAEDPTNRTAARMVSSILMDGYDLLRAEGTGIASYGRTLATTLKSAGYSVGILFGQSVAERAGHVGVQVFGKEPPAREWRRNLADVTSVLRAVRSRSIEANNVPLSQIDLRALDSPLPPFDFALNASGAFKLAELAFALRGRFTEVLLPRKFDVMHWTRPMPIRARDTPNIYTLHDMVPLQFPYMVMDRGARLARLHTAIAHHADLIVTVSEASRRHIVELLGVPSERVCVTYQPVPSLPALPQVEAERLVETLYGATPGQYALFLGAVEPKKNLKRLIDAFLVSGVKLPLLIAGPLGWLCDGEMALLEMIAQASQARQVRQSEIPVRRLGFVPRLHLVALLKCARFFAFPSIYEGFGLPVLEAMQVGIPVLTSNTGSFPEVAGDAAILVDPLNVSAMAEQIRRLANDEGLRSELAIRGPVQAAKFSVASYRARLDAAYRNLNIAYSSAARRKEVRHGFGHRGAVQ